MTDMKIIDFQFVGTGSPVHDLSYCFYVSGSKESFGALDFYLKLYHTNLTKTLHMFNLNVEEIYTFQTLKKEWKKYCKVGFAMGISCLKLRLIDEIMEKNLKITVTIEKEKECRDRMRQLIYHMCNNDFL